MLLPCSAYTLFLLPGLEMFKQKLEVGRAGDQLGALVRWGVWKSRMWRGGWYCAHLVLSCHILSWKHRLGSTSVFVTSVVSMQWNMWSAHHNQMPFAVTVLSTLLRLISLTGFNQWTTTPLATNSGLDVKKWKSQCAVFSVFRCTLWKRKTYTPIVNNYFLTTLHSHS